MSKKIACISILFSISFFAFTFKGAKNEIVIGTVMHSGVSCGGVELSPEEYEQIATPKPFPDQKLYVKKGRVNDFKSKPVLEFTSDANGKFTISLPPGEYCIVNEFKNDKKKYDSILKNHKVASQNYSAVDKNCLAKWFATPDLIFTVLTGKENKITISFQDQCPWYQCPCVQYDGPLPP